MPNDSRGRLAAAWPHAVPGGQEADDARLLYVAMARATENWCSLRVNAVCLWGSGGSGGDGGLLPLALVAERDGFLDLFVGGVQATVLDHHSLTEFPVSERVSC